MGMESSPLLRDFRRLADHEAKAITKRVSKLTDEVWFAFWILFSFLPSFYPNPGVRVMGIMSKIAALIIAIVNKHDTTKAAFFWCRTSRNFTPMRFFLFRLLSELWKSALRPRFCNNQPCKIENLSLKPGLFVQVRRQEERERELQKTYQKLRDMQWHIEQVDFASCSFYLIYWNV